MELKLSSYCTAVTLSRDASRAFVASQDGVVSTWDVAKGRRLGSADVHVGRIVAISCDGLLAVGFLMRYDAHVWDLKRNESVLTLEGHARYVWCAAFSRDARLVATGSFDSTIRVWDSATGECLKVLRGHTEKITRVQFSFDGKLLASASRDFTARVWEVETGNLVSTFDERDYAVTSVCFSRNSRVALTGADGGTVRVWDVRTGESKGLLFKHGSFVTDVAIAPDGRTAISAAADETTKMWDLRSGRELCVLREEESDHFVTLALSEDGNTLLTGTSGAFARVLDATPSWKKEMWSVLSTPKWDAEMARELSHFF